MDLVPVFKEAPKPVHVSPGETIKLSCRVEGKCLQDI